MSNYDEVRRRWENTGNVLSYKGLLECFNDIPYLLDVIKHQEFNHKVTVDAAAYTTKQLQAQVEQYQNIIRRLKNELCIKCGRYREAHQGACENCLYAEL